MNKYDCFYITAFLFMIGTWLIFKTCIPPPGTMNEFCSYTCWNQTIGTILLACGSLLVLNGGFVDE